ncbi:hypothetical protein ACJJTC_006968 [Scirpophaga incertulas]
MAHLEGILEGQKSLEEKVNKKMEELQQQLLNAGPHKDTVAKVAEEFRTFRELIFNMIGLLRNQIEECVKHIELFENRHRQKALVFMGIPEVEKESCTRPTLMKQVDLTKNALLAAPGAPSVSSYVTAAADLIPRAIFGEPATALGICSAAFVGHP